MLRRISGRLGAVAVALLAVVLVAAPRLAPSAAAEEIGEVDTAFKLLGPNHRIIVEAFDDPEIPGVTCHVSRAVTGGVSGALGLAEDTSDASIACRQVGPITLPDDPEDMEDLHGEEVFSERRSIMFKRLRVVRFWDEKREVLIYLVYSDKLIEGSPKNAISSVPVMPWSGS